MNNHNKDLDIYKPLLPMVCNKDIKGRYLLNFQGVVLLVALSISIASCILRLMYETIKRRK